MWVERLHQNNIKVKCLNFSVQNCSRHACN
uniref:Uncharacterized protein n=1 Tax=Rhizophora mucronata TaxID=61149 RepID=A0A2P2KGV4_RHIMU